MICEVMQHPGVATSLTSTDNYLNWFQYQTMFQVCSINDVLYLVLGYDFDHNLILGQLCKDFHHFFMGFLISRTKS